MFDLPTLSPVPRTAKFESGDEERPRSDHFEAGLALCSGLRCLAHFRTAELVVRTVR